MAVAAGAQTKVEEVEVEAEAAAGAVATKTTTTKITTRTTTTTNLGTTKVPIQIRLLVPPVELHRSDHLAKPRQAQVPAPAQPQSQITRSSTISLLPHGRLNPTPRWPAAVLALPQ